MIGASKLYPDALMVFPGAQENNMRELFLKSPEYNFNFTLLKDINLEDITRLILVDCQHASRIGPFAAIVDKKGLDIHIYDHHPDVENKITYSKGIIRNCGSTTAIIALMLRERNEVLSIEEATAMMLGVYEDTGSLIFPSTTIDDYQAAAWLMSQGANLNVVADYTSQELTSEQVALLNDLLESLKIVNYYNFTIGIASRSIEEYVDDAAVLARKIRDIEGLDSIFLVLGMGARVHIIARSRIKDLNTALILKEFGGGGHATAAAATVRDLTVIQTVEKLENLIGKIIKSGLILSAIMSSPVKTVSSGTNMEEAREIISRYNLNAMPVIKNGEMAGVISRQIVEKSLFHNLGKVPVSEYMYSDFMQATPETPIQEVINYLAGHNHRIVPVFKDGALVGIVTRTDILRYLHNTDESKLYKGRENSHSSRNIKGKLKGSLQPEIYNLLVEFGKTGDELGLNVYAVGGFVRDMMIGEKNLDIDITVEGDGIKFAEQFAKKYGARVKSHEKFGTAVILFSDKKKIDVASTRLEYYDSPGVLPTVERSSLKMDMYRRDFSINTLAISLIGKEFGKLVDYFGGRRDLKEKSIKVLHNLSFVEDPTRVFRAVRFEQRLGFNIAAQTEDLIKSAVKMDFFEKLKGKRLLSELIHIFQETNFVNSIERMGELGLLKFIHPSITLKDELLELLKETQQVVSWFELLYLDITYEKWVVVFLSLCDLLESDEFIETCKRLSVVEQYTKKLSDYKQISEKILGGMISKNRNKTLTSSFIFRSLNNIPVEIALYIMAKSNNKIVKQSISSYFTHLKSVGTILSGKDLEKLGIPKGKVYKEYLNLLLDAKLDGTVSSKEDEINFIKNILMINTKM